MRLIKQDFRTAAVVFFVIAAGIFNIALLATSKWPWVGLFIGGSDFIVAGFLSFEYLKSYRKVLLDAERLL